MTRIEHRLCFAGLALFLIALLQGFVIPVFDRVEIARAAHATALGSGTFLIAVGLLWPKLSFQRLEALWAALLVTSLYAIAVGTDAVRHLSRRRRSRPSRGRGFHRGARCGRRDRAACVAVGRDAGV